ncbi:MAG TPA: hypothetical protein VIE38_12905, partial [Gaiellaceae bacterium]
MSERRKYLALMGAIMAAVIGAVLLATPGSPIHRKPILGLDLQGGLEVVLKAVPLKGQQVTPSGMSVAQSIIQSRVNKLGLSSPDVRKQGSNQLVVQLAGVHNAAQAAALLGKTAQLMMFDFEADLTGPSTNAQGQPVATPSLYDLLTQVQTQAKKGSPEAYYLFRNKAVPAKTKNGTPTVTHSLLQGPQSTVKELLAPYRGKVPPDGQIMKVPAHQLVVSCPVANGCIGATVSAQTYYYLFKYDPTAPNGPPELTGRDLTQSGTRADFNPTTGAPIVLLGFTSHGAHEFQQITKAEYQRGKIAATIGGQPGTLLAQYEQHNAIVLDGVLQSTPYIDYTQSSLQDGISGGAEIDMGAGGQKAAQDLALVLQTGALPYNFQQIERTDVSSTLGKDSLTQAWHAALVGLIVVAIFLLVLYRFLGLVAVFGLAIYAALYYAAILLFNV